MLKDATAIVGIGQTDFGKGLADTELSLACQAISLALDDAGIAPAEVDGLASFTMEPGFKFDHKDAQQLRYFLTDRGKIVPRRVSGLSAKQQRALTRAIQRARNLGLLPYTVKG